MFERPLFQDNILHNLWEFNKTFLTTRDWPLHLGIVLAVLLVVLFLLRKYLRSPSGYQNIFPADNFVFDNNDWRQWLSLLGVIVAIIFSEIYIYMGENSLFENYDLMAINTTRSMRYGLVASFDYIRVIPFASWYLSTLYAITQNILLIKSFVLLQTILAAWAMYAFFSYIPVARRLLMIALLIVAPTYLQSANIIFPERDMIIVLMLGLICARRYFTTHLLRWAFAFIFFMNVAMYTKETCITFYFGILLTSILYNVGKSVINFSTLIRPWQIIKQMPLETLIGLSLVGYTVIYIKMQEGDNFYLSANKADILSQLNTYRFELSLLAIAVIMAVRRVVLQPLFKDNPFFREGLLLGAICSALMVVAIFKLAPTTPHLAGKSYYLLVSTIFAAAYIFEHLRTKTLMALLAVYMLAYSLVMNIRYKQNENGGYYREIAEFMAEHTSTVRPNTLFVMEKNYGTKVLNQWIVETIDTAFRYYFDDRLMIFKSDAHHLDRSIVGKLNLYGRIPLIYFPIIPQALPQAGEWLIIHKQNTTTKANNLRQQYRANKVFENRLFEVYAPL